MHFCAQENDTTQNETKQRQRHKNVQNGRGRCLYFVLTPMNTPPPPHHSTPDNPIWLPSKEQSPPPGLCRLIKCEASQGRKPLVKVSCTRPHFTRQQSAGEGAAGMGQGCRHGGGGVAKKKKIHQRMPSSDRMQDATHFGDERCFEMKCNLYVCGFGINYLILMPK